MSQHTEPKPAQPTIAAANKALTARLPFDDTQDMEDAERGFMGTAGNNLITDGTGRTVWDLHAYGFLNKDCPDTANPSLWRQGKLCADHGLFEVTEGIYQVRGFDLSNMTLVEGERGILVIDPLLTTETAAAGLALYREHRGDRPVTGVLYTHSHVDHFGGVRGVVTDQDIADGVPVLAPLGFLEHAVSENVYAGTAMSRRSAYMYGAALPKGGRGQIGAGLGLTVSTGAVTLIPPTLDITRTGQTETVDGIRMVFQLTPGTEAPAELNIHFPDRSALCMAENATHNQHNLLTLRGAEVRDPRVWARYLTEAIDLFSGASDVAFASHHWPVWGREQLTRFLSEQRDLYAYLHDQTVRMLNRGMTALEIAEAMQMPPRSNAPGTRTATTARSATTPKRSTSVIWAGSTATRPTCGSTRRPRQPAATWTSWAAPTRSCAGPGSPSPTATSAGPRRSSTMCCSPTRATPTPANCRPMPWSSSVTAARTAPGATSTSPAPSNCGRGRSAPPPPPPPPTCSPR